MISARSLNLLVASIAHSSVDHYAKYKGEKTPSLFDDDDKPSWIADGKRTNSSEWDESKHPRVEKGSNNGNGGQFTSLHQPSFAGMTLADTVGKVGAKPDYDKKLDALKERRDPDGIESNEKLPLFDQAKSSSPEKPYTPIKTIPLRERKSYAESLANGGMSETDLADHLIKRGVASVDAKKLASDVSKPAKPESGIVLPPKTVPNDQAKPGEQLGLFGEATKEPKPVAKPKVDDPTKAKQGGLFDTHGNPDQMDLFGDGVMDKSLVYKPESKPIAIANKQELTKALTDAIADFGEKIGGARKDKAMPLGPRPKKEKIVDDRPAWQKKYHVAEDANRSGEYFVVNNVTQQPFGPDDVGRSTSSFSSMLAKQLGKKGMKLSSFKNFSSKEDAEKAVAQIEVSRNHGVTLVRGKDGKPDSYAIFRRVTDKKTPIVKGGFSTYHEAEKFMMEKDPVSIIEHQFPDWEDHSYLDSVKRVGKEHRPGGKDVKPKDFQEAFNFRGGEFGKWQMNQDGQTSLNHAYDGLHDLADIIGLPPRAMSLNGKLAIGFGSRGTGGKHSAKAHYEPDKEVINLTKMKGAGSLAHEWFHALDHYMAQQVHGLDRKGKKTESLLSEHLPYGNEHKGRQEVVDAWRDLVNTMNSKTVDEKIQGDDKQLSKAKKTVSEVVDQLDEMLESNKRYNKRHKGLNEEQRKEWDAAKEKVKNLEVGPKTSIAALTDPDSKVWNSPSTFAPLQKLNELYKKATGRSFHTGDRNHGERIYWSIWRAQQEVDKIAKASEGETATRKRSTQFLDDSHALDKFRIGQYYAKDIEMAARAFQGYVYDKTEGVGKPSQYLNGKAHNKHYAGLITEDGDPFRPFPEGSEREALNAAFDKLFKTIKTQDREDEKGKHVELYSWVNSDDLAYDESDCELANDLYSALAGFVSVDCYDWNSRLHPRDNIGRFTQVREIADHPVLQRHHSLHIGNQDVGTRLQLSDYSKQYKNLIARASRISDSQDEETIWKNVDKKALQDLLARTNADDRKRKANGQTGLDSLFNANQVIPSTIAKRLSGGARFFDPEKLRGKWNEPAPPPQEPQQTAPSQPIQPEQPRETTHDGLSTRKRNEVNKAISDLVSDNPNVIEEFRPILINAWKQKVQEANDHNQAIRQITGTKTPQAMSALIRGARNKTLDPSEKRNFDIMVHSAETGPFGHLLRDRGEDGLLDFLSEGVKQQPDILDDDVAQLAVSMAGPSFFHGFDAGHAPSEWDAVPFSSNLVREFYKAMVSDIDWERYSIRNDHRTIQKLDRIGKSLEAN